MSKAFWVNAGKPKNRAFWCKREKICMRPKIFCFWCLPENKRMFPSRDVFTNPLCTVEWQMQQVEKDLWNCIQSRILSLRKSWRFFNCGFQCQACLMAQGNFYDSDTEPNQQCIHQKVCRRPSRGKARVLIWNQMRNPYKTAILLAQDSSFPTRIIC